MANLYHRKCGSKLREATTDITSGQPVIYVCPECKQQGIPYDRVEVAVEFADLHDPEQDDQ